MERHIVFRFVGGVRILLGIVLVSNPELVSNKPASDNTFAVSKEECGGVYLSALDFC